MHDLGRAGGTCRTVLSGVQGPGLWAHVQTKCGAPGPGWSAGQRCWGWESTVPAQMEATDRRTDGRESPGGQGCSPQQHRTLPSATQSPPEHRAGPSRASGRGWGTGRAGPGAWLTGCGTRWGGGCLSSQFNGLCCPRPGSLLSDVVPTPPITGVPSSRDAEQRAGPNPSPQQPFLALLTPGFRWGPAHHIGPVLGEGDSPSREQIPENLVPALSTPSSVKAPQVESDGALSLPWGLPT